MKKTFYCHLVLFLAILLTCSAFASKDIIEKKHNQFINVPPLMTSFKLHFYADANLIKANPDQSTGAISFFRGTGYMIDTYIAPNTTKQILPLYIYNGYMGHFGFNLESQGTKKRVSIFVTNINDQCVIDSKGADKFYEAPNGASLFRVHIFVVKVGTNEAVIHPLKDFTLCIDKWSAVDLGIYIQNPRLGYYPITFITYLNHDVTNASYYTFKLPIPTDSMFLKLPS